MSTNLPEELLGVDEVGLDEQDADVKEDGDGDEEPEEHERVLVFKLGEQSYGLDVADVRSIVEVGERTRVPRSSEAVEGVMDLRGEITAVIDPGVLLPVSSTAAEETQRVVVFDRATDKQSAGIRVDAVEGVESFPVSRIRRDEPEFQMPAGDLVKAVVEIPPEDGDDADAPAERISVIDADLLVESAG